MQDKLKENISKSEHLAKLFAEREGATNFSQVGTNPKENFFSQEGINPKELGSFQGIYFQLSCTILYGTVVAHFSRKHLWARFSRRSKIFFKHRNSYSPYYLVQLVPLSTVRTF